MNGITALEIVREFVADVMAAHNNNYAEAMAALETDWLDLALTFQKAYALVACEDGEQ